MLNLIQANIYPNVEEVQSKGITKIPWKPIPASSTAVIKKNDHEVAARSVLYNSEYVNGNVVGFIAGNYVIIYVVVGNGYYLYAEKDLNDKNNLICTDNNTTNNANKEAGSIIMSLPSYW